MYNKQVISCQQYIFFTVMVSTAPPPTSMPPTPITVPVPPVPPIGTSRMPHPPGHMSGPQPPLPPYSGPHGHMGPPPQAGLRVMGPHNHGHMIPPRHGFMPPHNMPHHLGPHPMHPPHPRFDHHLPGPDFVPPPPLPRSGPMMARMPYHGHAGRHPHPPPDFHPRMGGPPLQRSRFIPPSGPFSPGPHQLHHPGFPGPVPGVHMGAHPMPKTTVPPTDRLLSSEVTSSGPNLVDSHQEHKFTSDSGLSQSSYQDVNVHAYQGPASGTKLEPDAVTRPEILPKGPPDASAATDQATSSHLLPTDIETHPSNHSDMPSHLSDVKDSVILDDDMSLDEEETIEPNKQFSSDDIPLQKPAAVSNNNNNLQSVPGVKIKEVDLPEVSASG